MPASKPSDKAARRHPAATPADPPPMNTSTTRRAIRQISKQCAAALAPHGFKLQSPHLHRLMPDGLYHAINFQSSQWGDRHEGRFTINLIVTSQWLHTHWTNLPFPKNPGSAPWPILRRLGQQLPAGNDKWWDVNADTNLDALFTEISRALIKHALPFFAQYPDSQAILDRVRTGGFVHSASDAQRPLIAAILLVEKRQPEAAREILLNALKENAGSPFAKTINLIASRLGIKLQAPA
ncbi:DUF4304 domain-containing protein [Ereboglobus luteus]|nr:DUF4304 domain-containing protein [Ereboglobus luteus]